ncbi:MAG: HPr(Ser) kinase/phosphatase [Clostridia bacterium]|nr:HPr(Ser) kinase/phosphatase [Clostridia bacterium]
MINAAEFVNKLKLSVYVPTTRVGWNITSPNLNRPGMQFTGFYDYFAWERPQIIGRLELAYLESRTPEQRQAICDRFFSYNIPCIVCCRGIHPPQEITEAARAHDVAIYLTGQSTTTFTLAAINHLNRCLAPRTMKHGVLMDVYGMGVLITGDSGAGKSETALELVKRGHQLVADDVVDITRVNEHRLVGECPEMVRHFMEIRGIGIIDIRAMYGVGSVALSKSIDLVIHLERWVEGKEYDRLGLQEEYETILGVKVPRLLTPVRPGRNMAIIVEVAARNFSLRRMGYSAAHELDRRLNEMMSKRAEEEE